MRGITKTAIVALMIGLTSGLALAADQNGGKDGGKEDWQKPAAPVAGAASKHWAYQPVQEQYPPQVKQQGWVRQPVDAFVLAKIEEKGLKPSAETDRVTFIRRATLDAWGLIPSPEEVKAFVEDKSPNAYEKLVDRLLASPHYGERQARRWLDLVRYSDSEGFQGDQTRANAFRYRDYVVAAYNDDKPYDQFLKEQLAGDEIAPDKPEALIATYFLASYPDNLNSRDMIQRKYQIETDMTDTVGQALLGQTVGCARCHNHKFDKISQKDYFSLQSFFANTSIDNKIPAPRGALEAKYEDELKHYLEATKDIRDRQKVILDSVREAAVKYHKERNLTDTRDSLFKPKEQWTALDRWVNHRYDIVTTDRDLSNYLRMSSEKGRPEYDPGSAEKWAQYQKLDADLRKLIGLRPSGGSIYITAVTELGHADAPPTHIRFSGIHERPLDEVQPAFPAVITSEAPDIKPTATSSGRRTALANWIASPTNPLTARVYVNRIWAQYFGRGIVETVSDFGKAGTKPTHPELLDYLADNFVKSGWSTKQLQRQILLSATYRQSSNERPEVAKLDADNKLLAQFPRKRLEAEEIRDSILLASGRLVDKLGGPSVFPPIPGSLAPGDSVFDGNPLWVTSKNPEDHDRRSLYIFTRRSVPYPLLDVFNGANPQLVHSKRDVTTSPLQALSLFNSDLVRGWSQSLAGRVIREAGSSESAELDRLFQILFGRNPDAQEKKALLAFLDDQERLIRDKKAVNGSYELTVPKDVSVKNPIRAAAFVDLVHTALNTNEFVYRF